MNTSSLPDLDATYAVRIADIDAFRRDGHVKLRGVFDGSELCAYRPELQRVVAESPPEHHAMEQKVAGSGKNWMFINNLWRLDESARRLVLSRRLGRIAAELLGVPAVRLFRDQSYFKGPGGSNTPWHQDAYFMPLDTEKIVTFWIPLTDITPEMAPMSYVTGSHAAGYLGTSNGDDASMDDFEAGLSQRGFGFFNYQTFAAGDIAVHAGMTLHASRVNRSERTREAIVIVYFADGARVLPEKPFGRGTPPQEAFAALIRRQNRATSLHGLMPGELADGPMTPLVHGREGEARQRTSLRHEGAAG
jgi:ectoine hydroxylase-related dioxygenase (phytanoyl-CoA dioxygenase family)